MEPTYHLSQQMQHLKKHAWNTDFLNLCQWFQYVDNIVTI
jgi:hypothetical protein